jgi:hypothetical protein
MKLTLTLLAWITLAAPLFAQEDAIARHFGSWLQDDRYTSVYVSARMFQAMADREDKTMDENLRQMIRSLRGMRVVQQQGADGSAAYRSAGEKLQSARFEELMTLKEKGEQVRFFTQGGSGQKVGELVMLVSGPKRFLMLSMVGDIDLGQVSRLSKSLNVQGADLLERVKK